MPFRKTRMFAVPIAACAIAGPVVGQEMDWRVATPAFVAISVADLETSASWYADLFGLEVERELEAPDGSVRVQVLRGQNIIVELIAHREPLGIPEEHAEEPAFRFTGLFKSGLFVEAIDAMHRDVLSRGGDVDARIGVDEALGMRMFVFRDPEGNRLQAFEPCGEQCGGS